MSALIEELAEYLNEGLSEFYITTQQTTHLYFNDIVEEHDDYVVAEFYGGLNGCGNWFNYIHDITVLFDILQSEHECWLISLENDCLDDVFYLKVGIKKK